MHRDQVTVLSLDVWANDPGSLNAERSEVNAVYNQFQNAVRRAADDGLQETGFDLGTGGDYWECDLDAGRPSAHGGCVFYTELNNGNPAYLCSLWISTGLTDRPFWDGSTGGVEVYSCTGKVDSMSDFYSRCSGPWYHVTTPFADGPQRCEFSGSVTDYNSPNFFDPLETTNCQEADGGWYRLPLAPAVDAVWAEAQHIALRFPLSTSNRLRIHRIEAYSGWQYDPHPLAKHRGVLGAGRAAHDCRLVGQHRLLRLALQSRAQISRATGTPQRRRSRRGCRRWTPTQTAKTGGRARRRAAGTFPPTRCRLPTR